MSDGEVVTVGEPLATEGQNTVSHDSPRLVAGKNGGTLRPFTRETSLAATRRRVEKKRAIVAAAAQCSGINTEVELSSLDKVRLGNLMARSRMLLMYDLARQHNALVCGTENKSEHYLGYFTRFGDAASDLEPLTHLYKTQVRLLAQHLALPAVFWQKAPSAGLWAGQTDEAELGFTYQQADQVLFQLIDRKQPITAIAQLTGLDEQIVTAVHNQVEKSAFKLVVPYIPEETPV